MRRLLPFLLAFAVLGGLVALFRAAQRFEAMQAGRVLPSEDPLNNVRIQIREAVVISRAQGVPRYTVQAKEIRLRQTPNGGLENLSGADFVGIHDGILFREGKPDVFFAAQNASFDQATQRFTVSGGIQARTVRNDTLTAESLVWSEREDFVQFPQGADGVFHKQSVHAPFLLFSPRRRIVQCPQGAEGRFNGNPVRADSLFWDINAEMVNCPGTVTGVYKRITYTASGVQMNLKTREIHANKANTQLRIEGENDLEKLP